ncbi:MAG: DUF1439 domain-containing protein [Desulfobacteraceae bacterium]|nr:DUF1439 domain-containing protein [Pseudomonadota bacterium]MCG2757013.1 DUF1439 domain-containing protein [Desulfobacteraceae bacterium]
MGMTKKSNLLLVIIIMLFMGCTKFNVIITNPQIQEKLDSKFPITKTYLLFFEITYKNARIILQNGSDKVRIGLDVTLNIPINENPELLSGGVEIISDIDFNSDAGQLFLIDCQIDKLSLKGVPPTYTDKVNDILNISVKEYLNNFPIYTLSAKDIKTTAVKLLIKDVKIRDGVLVVTLGV